MKRMLIPIFVVLLTTSSITWGQSSDRYRYLVNATNEMSRIVGQSVAPDREALLRVTAQACNALSMLLEDGQFYEDLSQLDDQAPASREERDQLKRELDIFISSFMRIEEHALREAGVEERTAKEILWSASMFRNSIDADVTPEYLLEIISNLQAEVCQGARRLQSEEDSATRWATVRKWSFRIGGVTLIAVDVGGAAISAGITAPVAAGSAAIGGAIAGWSE
ncbi:hypothetical protein EBB56_02235 [Halomonas sp. YLB-10]|uniref:hypothetical protein n=1 Tax=unclassified Halomonas TaxID=2609666 RepID=UPI000F5F4778|nr:MULTISPECIES: hypothetical protein [unclassified Halomonas]RQW72806.1 hypothetical protein EBB56_02235 [Halomonas sp. YLB-10]